MTLPRVPDILGLGHRSDVRIVLIPGLGPTGPPVRDWGLCNDAWQDRLRRLKFTNSISTIEHGVVVDNRFTYDLLLEAGERLQRSLLEWYEREEKDVPLILVAHSLGGTILKQALCWLKVRADSYLHYARVLNLIAGVVFISSPHGLYDDIRLKKHTSFLLNRCASGSLGSQTLQNIETGFPTLLNIHKKYSEVGFRFETLSLFETQACTQKKTLGRSKSITVVDKDMALIDRETVIGLDGDHFKVCALSDPDDQPNMMVVERLGFMIESAIERVQERIAHYDRRLSQSKTPSLRTQASVEAMRKAFSEVSVEAAATSQATLRGSPVFNKDMDTIFEKFAPNQLQVKLPCFMMDSSFNKNTDFFGRQSVIDQIDQLLLPDPKSIAPSSDPCKLSIVALNGMPGLGKTEIAMEYVFTRQSYFDGVFWICAENETKLETDFCRIAVELGIQNNEDQVNPTITKNKIRDWLSKPRKILHGPDDMSGLDEATWLLVFDNADDPVILQDYLQIYGRGSILITSRYPEVKNYADAVVIDLQPFQDDEALEFLNQLTRKSSTDNEDRLIAELLAGLPLAIAQMASIIRDQFLEYADLLESLQNPEDRRDMYKDGRVNKTARGDMTSIWMIEKLDCNARSLLEVISCLFPDRIADDLLLTRKDGQLVIEMRRPVFNKSRAQLLRSSLIRHNDDKKQLWMHRVPREVVRANMDKESQKRAFSRALDLVKAAWPVVHFESRHNKETVTLRDGLLPHVLSLTEFYEREWHVKEAKTDYTLATLLQETAWFMYERGNLVRAKPLALLSLKIANSPTLSNFDGQLSLLSYVHDTLGCIANGTNMPLDSMSHNQRFITLRKQLSQKSGIEDFELGYAHNQMGCASMMNKDYERGRELFIEALRIWHGNPKYRKGLASMEYANLGMCYWLLGETDKASDILEEGLKEREEGFGLESTESFRPGRIFHALGNVRASQERYAESEDLHQRAMKVYLAAVGPQYHRVADMSHKLAQHCMRRADEESIARALKLVDQALSIWRADESAYKPEIARTTFLKSKLLYYQSVLQGNSDVPNNNNHELFDEALKMFRHITGRNPKDPGRPTETDFDELVMFWSR